MNERKKKVDTIKNEVNKQLKERVDIQKERTNKERE